MKLYKCTLMGTVDSDGCYACFMGRQDKNIATSRVMCKKENVTEEMNVTEQETVAV